MTRRGERRGRRASTGGSATIASQADASQLLPMALHHHERGDLGRARTLYEQIVAANPEHADALQFFGILEDQQGNATAAESLIRRAIGIRADVAPYHDNLGTVLERAGRLDEALAAYEAAEALEPGDPDRHYNMGLVLERAGRPQDAERRLRQALALRGGDADCRFALANVLKRQGVLGEAEILYRQVLTTAPRHHGAAVNLANLLQDRGESDEPARLYREVLARDPRDAAALHNQARMLRKRGRIAEARAGFERATAIEPGLDDARLGLAQCQEETGELDAALAGYRALCAARAGGEDARAGLVRVARIVAPEDFDEVLAAALVEAAAGEAAVPASSLARAAGRQLRARAITCGPVLDDDTAALAAARSLAAEPLFGLVLERTVNVDVDVERWLTRARRALLLAAAVTPADRALLVSLALQCSGNDHVYRVTAAETAQLDAWQRRIEAWLAGDTGHDAPGGESLALFACYRRLADLDGARRLAGDAVDAEDWLQPVLDRSLRQPLDERERAAAVPALGDIEDAASREVRAQYEEHPYPRWQELPPAAAIGGPARERLEHAAAQRERLEILVAGCGTGQEPLALASRFPGNRIAAVDLSRASLAYGLRMAERFGIAGVEFLHGDLLQVARIGRRFPIVTATGVLHHMADPMAGWRALRACLAPGGIMRVGLYSAASRRVVNAARERIEVLGLARDGDAVRALRARILDGQEPGLESLLDSEDFFTTSTCRDLLFHPVEHQFDLPDIARCLDELELRFLGFELPHPLMSRMFERAGVGDATDLGAWARFEAAHPDFFEAMYVFWCADGGTLDA